MSGDQTGMGSAWKQNVLTVTDEKVGSSYTVWHGRMIENRHRESILHEIPHDIKASTT